MNANEHDRRLEEVAAYALGALDPARVEDLERHLADCRRCQEELRWLAPAVQALPEAVESQAPPPELKQRLMAEVRADAAAEERRARGEERRERAESRPGLGEWLRGLKVGGLTWKPLAGLAVVVLIVAGGIGYAVGNGGGTGGAHTTKVEPGSNGIAAKVVTEGDRGEIHRAGVEPLPKGRVLEAWVELDGIVEAVDPDGTIHTIEGNSSDQVSQRTYGPDGGGATGYVRLG